MLLVPALLLVFAELKEVSNTDIMALDRRSLCVALLAILLVRLLVCGEAGLPGSEGALKISEPVLIGDVVSSCCCCCW